MTHPEARADAGSAAAGPNEARRSLLARGHSTSGDKDAGADRASARPPTSPPADRARKGARGSDTAIRTAARPPAPTHSHTATPTDRPPKPRAPSRSEERDGETEPTSRQLYLCRVQSQDARHAPTSSCRWFVVGVVNGPRVQRGYTSGARLRVARSSREQSHDGCQNTDRGRRGIEAHPARPTFRGRPRSGN